VARLRSDAPDTELWNQASEHDGSAFGELFERHSNAVYNHCFRRTASWSRAEDLTSVVFLEAWRKRGKVRFYGDSIRPWLLAVANNVLRNSNRSLHRYGRLVHTVPARSIEPDFADEVSTRLDDERAMAAVLTEIHTLKDREQEVIALCDWSGLTTEEAAAAMGVPVGTVKSRLSRAHEHLRVRLRSASNESIRVMPLEETP
jgi:RNA polymerase sigma factor (sigma-70 family)